jgi:hypothetical protein
MPRDQRPGPDDARLREAIDFVRREERRACDRAVQDAWHDGFSEGKEDGYHDGYKTGYRKGWIEAGGDTALADSFGVRLDDRAWARGVLHLPPDATLEEAQRAFRKLSKAFHPDLNPGLGDAPFKTLLEAKRILGL